MSGLTHNGFEPRRLEDILLSVRAELEAAFGPDFNTSADSVTMQLLGGLLIEVALIWEALADQYRAYDPAQATGEALDVLARFRGVARLGQRRATGTIEVSGTPATIIPAGSRVLNPTTNVTVETTAQAVLDGAGEATISVRAIEYGPVTSAADGLTQIVTPVAGWSSVTGSSALVGGRFKESDADLRGRLAASTADGAVGTESAIKSALLRLEYVTSALVKSNRGLTTDGDGTPAKSVRVVISPDLSGDAEAEQAIVEALFATLPAGIPSVGLGLNARVATVIDDQGFTQQIGWEYPTEVPIYVDVTATVDLTVGPLTEDEAEAIGQEALEVMLSLQQVGQDVLLPDLIAALRDGVPGLRDAVILFGASPAPSTSTPIVIAFNQRAVVGEVAVEVTSS